MSMDLYLWKAPVIDDADEARALLDRFYDRNEVEVFKPSKDVSRALARIRELYPDDAGRDDGPWSSWPIDDSDRLIALNIRWSVDGEVLDAIVDIAKEHDLVIYDPQGPDVYRAQDAPEPQPDERATVKDVLGVVLGLFLPFVGATLAIWWFVPWGWLRWPLVAIGVFLSISAGIVVYAMVASLVGKLDEEPAR